jgi:hypothetical protein
MPLIRPSLAPTASWPHLTKSRGATRCEAGKKSVRLFGYATRRPNIAAQTGSAGEVAFDERTGRFEVSVSPSGERVNEGPGNDPVRQAIVSIQGS